MTDHIDDASRTEAFFALHHRLPRQSPGSDATTRRLLALAGPLPDRPRALDLGCGPGRASLLLAAEAGAEVTAVDLHRPFLDELDEAAQARGLGDRVRTVRADMGDLTGPDFPAGSFDLVWAEGSAYRIGFATAVRDWQRLLAPGGAMMVSECVWTTEAPSAGARAFWERNGSLRTLPETTAAAVAAGCAVSAVLLHPDSDWDTYYVPLAERVESADPTVPGMEWVLAATREELAVRREYGAEFGYAAYVLRPADPVPAGDAPVPRGGGPVAASPAHRRQGPGRPWCGRSSMAHGCAARRSWWCPGTPVTTRASAPYRRPATRSGPVSRLPDEAVTALVLDDSAPVPVGMIRNPAAFAV
ncbi:Methyltransferase domain-containing protein [Streptomyces sp. ScaeMP-e83]|nr:Methyltransferase domain-containing protein [Streptomyces sp. ScaeMP-e83]